MCGDAEPFDFSRITFPKARKRYRCCECGSDIDPGEKHEYITGAFEGGFDSYRTCLTCANIRDAAQRELDYPIGLTCLYELVGSEFEEAGI